MPNLEARQQNQIDGQLQTMRRDIESLTFHYEELKKRRDHQDAMPVEKTGQPVNLIMVGDQATTIDGEEGRVVELLEGDIGVTLDFGKGQKRDIPSSSIKTITYQNSPV